MQTITPPDRVRIAAQATVDPRTVMRIYAGERATPNVRDRVERAARDLGLPPPPAMRQERAA